MDVVGHICCSWGSWTGRRGRWRRHAAYGISAWRIRNAPAQSGLFDKAVERGLV